MKKVKSILALLLSMLMVVGCIATASAATLEEAEPNNDAATATAVAIGSAIEGALSTATDVDYYSITTAKSGLVTVTLTHDAVSGADASVSYFEVTVTNSSNNIVAAFSSAGSSSSDSSSAFSVGANETYYVAVKAGTVYSGSLGYSVSAAIDTDVLSESEPNNTATAANALEISTTGNAKHYYGALSEGDVDYFKITVPSAGVVNLYLYNDAAEGGNYTATLQTYVEGTSGAQELADVTSIAIASSESSKIGPSVGLAAGDYIVKIEGDIGSYRTRVLFRSNSSAESEINDTPIAADAISIGKEYKATIDEKADIDIFKFTAAADNDGYTVTFTATNAGQWKVYVQNSDNETVKAMDVVAIEGTKTFTVSTDDLKAGTYYIKVTAGATLDTGIYSLTVTANEPSDDDDDSNLSLIDRIKALNWGALADNLKGWFEFVDVGTMLKSMVSSIVTVITYISSML